MGNHSKEYHSSEHLVYSCQYHVIFCPKYRKRILKDDTETAVKECFVDVAKRHNFSILEMEVMPNHVHLPVDCNPRYGILNCIKQLKRWSATKILELNSRLKYLPTVWSRSFFVSSVGAVSLEVVRKYIENQKGE